MRHAALAAVQPGSYGGPVLDASGNLLGVTVARMSDIAALEATQTVPQNVNFGIKADIAASFLRVNGVEPKLSTDTVPIPPPQIAAAGKGFTAQVMWERGRVRFIASGRPMSEAPSALLRERAHLS